MSGWVRPRPEDTGARPPGHWSKDLAQDEGQGELGRSSVVQRLVQHQHWEGKTACPWAAAAVPERLGLLPAVGRVRACSWMPALLSLTSLRNERDLRVASDPERILGRAYGRETTCSAPTKTMAGTRLPVPACTGRKHTALPLGPHSMAVLATRASLSSSSLQLDMDGHLGRRADVE